MPEIGEVKKTKEIGYKSGNSCVWHACIDCGKERWVQIIKGKPQRIRCLTCSNRKKSPLIGEESPAWKGGRRVNSRGYILVRLYPDDFFYSMTRGDSYVYEHRLVVARALGRCLHPWEVVHHKGTKYSKGSKEDKQDNRYPGNLQLVTDDRHKQITILESRIKQLEQRVTLLEAENILLKEGQIQEKGG